MATAALRVQCGECVSFLPGLRAPLHRLPLYMREPFVHVLSGCWCYMGKHRRSRKQLAKGEALSKGGARWLTGGLKRGRETRKGQRGCMQRNYATGMGVSGEQGVWMVARPAKRA